MATDSDKNQEESLPQMPTSECLGWGEGRGERLGHWGSRHVDEWGTHQTHQLNSLNN